MTLENLALGAGFVVVMLIAAFGLIVVWKMWRNQIDLRFLIADQNGDASLSRFQFLIFTFVISASVLLITLESGAMPEVKTGVWALLGISGGSYVLSKGINDGPATTTEQPPTGQPLTNDFTTTTATF